MFLGNVSEGTLTAPEHVPFVRALVSPKLLDRFVNTQPKINTKTKTKTNNIRPNKDKHKSKDRELALVSLKFAVCLYREKLFQKAFSEQSFIANFETFNKTNA